MNSGRTLILSRSYFPQRVVDSHRAICMIFGNRIQTVLETAGELLGVIPYDRFREFPCVIKAYGRSMGDGKEDLNIFSPSVIVSSGRFHDIRREISFTRSHVYKRDSYTCQYCGRTRSLHDLNFDHVTPKANGGKTSWDNIVTSCYSCNIKKGGRTPEQAGMKLQKKPSRPSWQEMVQHDILSEMVDESWLEYVGNS